MSSNQQSIDMYVTILVQSVIRTALTCHACETQNTKALFAMYQPNYTIKDTDVLEFYTGHGYQAACINDSVQCLRFSYIGMKFIGIAESRTPMNIEEDKFLQDHFDNGIDVEFQNLHFHYQGHQYSIVREFMVPGDNRYYNPQNDHIGITSDDDPILDNDCDGEYFYFIQNDDIGGTHMIHYDWVKVQMPDIASTSFVNNTKTNLRPPQANPHNIKFHIFTNMVNDGILVLLSSLNKLELCILNPFTGQLITFRRIMSFPGSCRYAVQSYNHDALNPEIILKIYETINTNHKDNVTVLYCANDNNNKIANTVATWDDIFEYDNIDFSNYKYHYNINKHPCLLLPDERLHSGAQIRITPDMFTLKSMWEVQ